MKFLDIILGAIFLTLIFNSCDNPRGNIDTQKMMVRIAEIEIDSNYIEKYKAILKEESEASIRLEPGVISIYPMYRKDNPTLIRLLEIYVNREAYESHLKTLHFQKYKTTTLEMVKSLELIDMIPIDAETMPQIFAKLRE